MNWIELLNLEWKTEVIQKKKLPLMGTFSGKYIYKNSTFGLSFSFKFNCLLPITGIIKIMTLKVIPWT